MSWRGRWYLVGHDVVRGAERVFRLSRVVGAVTALGEPGAVVVPDGVDLRGLVARTAADVPRTTARVRVRAGRARALRREAAAAVPDGEGWDVVEVGYSDPERFADTVTGHGADVVVLEPAEARDAVVRRLRALVAAGQP